MQEQGSHIFLYKISINVIYYIFNITNIFILLKKYEDKR